MKYEGPERLTAERKCWKNDGTKSNRTISEKRKAKIKGDKQEMGRKQLYERKD